MKCYSVRKGNHHKKKVEQYVVVVAYIYLGTFHQEVVNIRSLLLEITSRYRNVRATTLKD